MRIDQMRQAYQVTQEVCDIDVGDTVKVLRKAESYENGWQLSWVEGMDYFIQKIGKVRCISKFGILVEIEKEVLHLPWFVLDKVRDARVKFKKYDRVLRRNTNSQPWRIDIFLCFIDNGSFYRCISGNKYLQCIPFEENEHFIDTTTNL